MTEIGPPTVRLLTDAERAERRARREATARKWPDLMPRDWELVVLNLVAGNGPMTADEIMEASGLLVHLSSTPKGRWRTRSADYTDTALSTAIHFTHKAVTRAKANGWIANVGESKRSMPGRWGITAAGEARRDEYANK